MISFEVSVDEQINLCFVILYFDPNFYVHEQGKLELRLLLSVDFFQSQVMFLSSCYTYKRLTANGELVQPRQTLFTMVHR